MAMKIIDKYIFKKFIGTFFFATALLIVVVIIFDLSENIDSFLKNNVHWTDVLLHYYIPLIPYFINLFIYLFTFISVIFFTSKMAANTEVVAILSSGVSFWRFLYPYILAAVLLVVMSLYLSNILIPHANTSRRVFKDAYMEKLATSGGRNIHVQLGPSEYVYVESYNIKKDLGYKFSWEKYDGNELKYKMLADVIYHDSIVPNKWKIDMYTERFIEGEKERIVQGRNLDTIINLYPTDLYKMKEDYEEMNFFEVRRHVAN